MKVTLALVALSTLFAYPPANDARSGIDPPCNGILAVKFYRAYNNNLKVFDHLYTTNVTEYKIATTKLGFSAEGPMGSIFPSFHPQTVPLYRLYNPTIHSHLITRSDSEKANVISKLGYKDEGVAGYVYPDNRCGAIPLYRLYSSRKTDYLYTWSTAERDSVAQKQGYTPQGIAAYIVNF